MSANTVHGHLRLAALVLAFYELHQLLTAIFALVTVNSQLKTQAKLQGLYQMSDAMRTPVMVPATMAIITPAIMLTIALLLWRGSPAIAKAIARARPEDEAPRGKVPPPSLEAHEGGPREVYSVDPS